MSTGTDQNAESIADRIAQLSPEKRAILEKLLQGKKSAPAQVPLVRQPRTGQPFPLSYAQQRLWFLAQLMPGNPFYNEQVAIPIKIALDPGLLERCMSEIVRRHEVLRTVFPTAGGQPAQVVAGELSLPLEVVDLSPMPGAERKAAAARHAYEQAQRPFDLERGPLLRLVLLKLDHADWVLLLTIHHIICDGWSLGVLTRELTALYQAYAGGQPSPLPELPIQYGDFAVWQRQWLQGEVLEQQLAYWRQQLAGLPQLQLPTDRPHSAVPSFRGSQQELVVPQATTLALKSLSQQEGATLFMTLLAAYSVLLGRYSGQEDIVLGSPIASRTRPELEPLIGLLLNSLILRIDLAGDPTFRELLQRVRRVALDAYAHQDLPFERLVDELQPERDLSRNPLFQVTMALHHMQDSARPFELETRGRTAKFDLRLDFVDSNADLLGVVEYSTDLFDRETIDRMIGHLTRLLDSIVADPDKPISRLALLTEPEREQLLGAWTTTRVGFPSHECLHQLFEAQAARTPSLTAVAFEDFHLTYHELNLKANQLAHYLRELGVGPDVMVGVCMQRSLELVVGLLAVLKAGGAYVPLDPSYPPERLAFMIEDCGAPVLLTQHRLSGRLLGHKGTILSLDVGWLPAHPLPAGDPPNACGPDNLAYVIYTSGSTGAPKGVMVSHAAICNHMHWMQSAFPLDAGDRVLQRTPSSFDASIWEFWAPLLAGACLVMLPPADQQTAADLIQAIRHEQITVIQVVPTMLRLLLDQDEFRACVSLKRVFAGGEALSPDVVKAFRSSHQAILTNLYGPTEAAIDSTYWVCRVDPERPAVSIGRPVANCQAFVLDRRLEPVPIGVPGELYIGGAGLARGYLKRPGLTAGRFIPNPFVPDSGARLYRTGDLARVLPDGNLEFLGRVDQQVKLHGYRIELGEIESVLSEHPAVHSAAAVVREVGPGDRRLVAYVAPHDAPGPSVTELRLFLQQRLPAYMIPSTFVVLESLPLTPSGKVDRRALPSPDAARPDLDGDYVPASTPVEKKLAEIWSQLLGIERIGVHDNFFALGGDSILSIQIVSRANQAGLQLTPTQLFQHQTIAELAAVAGVAPAIEAEQAMVNGPVPLTPIQHWFFEQAFDDPHHFNQVLLLAVAPGLDLALLDRAMQSLVAHHDALRLRFVEGSAGWEQFHAAPEGSAVVTRVDLSAVALAEQPGGIERLAGELQASLDLQRGPLVRVAHFQLGAKQADRLLLVIHHLAVDGVSWRILLDDLRTAYEQLRQGLPIQLPPKTTSFKRWAERLAAYARSGALSSQVGYWLAVPGHPAEPLPVDGTWGPNTAGSAHIVSTLLSAGDTRALLQEAPQAYNTQINDVLLTALVQAFAPWTQCRSLLIDLESHGREDLFDDVDLTRTVGWFTAMFPVELSLGEGLGPGDSIKSVKEQLRRIPQRGIGYGLLRYLQGDKDVAGQLESRPRPEISFNYLGQFGLNWSDAGQPKPAEVSSGPYRSPRGLRPHVLEVVGSVAGSQLRMDWVYSENIHRRETIEALAQSFIYQLRALIAHCQSPEAGGYTPFDFPKAKVSQKDLDRLVDLLGGAGSKGSD